MQSSQPPNESWVYSCRDRGTGSWGTCSSSLHWGKPFPFSRLEGLLAQKGLSAQVLGSFCLPDARLGTHSYMHSSPFSHMNVPFKSTQILFLWPSHPWLCPGGLAHRVPGPNNLASTHSVPPASIPACPCRLPVWSAMQKRWSLACLPLLLLSLSQKEGRYFPPSYDHSIRGHLSDTVSSCIRFISLF